LQAIPKEEHLIVRGNPDDPPFLRPSMASKMSVKTLGEVPTPERVEKMVKDELNGRAPEVVGREFLDKLKVVYDEALKQKNVALRDLRAQLILGLSDAKADDLSKRIQALEQEINGFQRRKEATEGLIRRYGIGYGFDINHEIDPEMYGVVVGYQHIGGDSKGGNPYSPSRFKIVFIVNAPIAGTGRLPVFLSKIEKDHNYIKGRSGGYVGQYGGPELSQKFALRQATGERRDIWIITGNIPAAYEAGIRGEIATFSYDESANKGRNEEIGVLMPPRWTPPQSLLNAPLRIRDWRQAAAYLIGMNFRDEEAMKHIPLPDGISKVPLKDIPSQAQTAGLHTRDRSLTVSYSGYGRWEVTSPDALSKKWREKDKTGKGDSIPDITDEDFVKYGRGGNSEWILRTDDPLKVAKIIEYVHEKGFPWVVEGDYVPHFERVLPKKAPPPTAFAKAVSGGQGILRQQFNAELAKAFGKVGAKNLLSAPFFKVVQSQDKLPAGIPIKSGDTILGVRYQGATYYVLDNLSPGMVKGIVLHELGVHYGLEKLLGPTKYREVMQQLQAMRFNGITPIVSAFEMARKAGTSAPMMAEEALAYLATHNANLPFVQRFLGWLKVGLFRLFGIPAKFLNPADLVMLANASVRNLIKETSQTGELRPADEAAFAKQETPEPDSSWGARKAKLDTSDRTFAEAVTDHVRGFMNSDGSITRWGKWVGTMYGIANKGKWVTIEVDGKKRKVYRLENPDFKKVYDKGQDYVAEIQRNSLDAASLAPRILSQLKTVGSLLPRLAQMMINSTHATASQKEIDAINSPVYDGTLFSPDGDPFKGKIWTDQELRDNYGLTNREIGLYHEHRAAVDRSLDLLLSSEAYKIGRNMGREVEIAIEAGRQDPANSGRIVAEAISREVEKLEKKYAAMNEAKFQYQVDQKEQLRQRIERYSKAATDLMEKQDRADLLKAHGYAPVQRFGQFTNSVYALTKSGTRGKLLYFSTHETKQEAYAMHRVLRNLPQGFFEDDVPDGKGGMKHVVYAHMVPARTGEMSKDAYRIFQGMSPDTMELMAIKAGMDQKEAVQEFLRLTKSNRSAMKRLIHRKGTAGFDMDSARSLASFVTSNARLAAANWHMGEMQAAVDQIAKDRGQLKDAAVALMEFLRDPKETAVALRGFLFAQFLGGSVASALVNMTQPFLMSVPSLAVHVGAVRAGAYMGMAATRATGLMVTGLDSIKDPALRAAMKLAEEEGHIAPHEIHYLYSEAVRSFGGMNIPGLPKGVQRAASHGLRKGMKVWGSLFQLAESWNRITTFLAAWEAAKASPNIRDKYAFAVKQVQETQGVYNRGNRPAWSRSAAGSVVFTFKQYQISYLEFLMRLPRQQRALALALLIMATGAPGLPWMEDVIDVIDTLMGSLGKSWNTKQEMRAWAERLVIAALGEEWQKAKDFTGKFVSGGLSNALNWSPVDVQGRMSLGNVLPGTGIVKPGGDQTKEIAEFAGAFGSYLKSVLESGSGLVSGTMSAKDAAINVMPRAVQDVFKAYDMLQFGAYRGKRGENIMETDKADAALKAIGLMPQKVGMESREVGIIMQLRKDRANRESAIVTQMAQSIFEELHGESSKNEAMVKSAQAKFVDALEKQSSWNAANEDYPILIDQSQITKKVLDMTMSRKERMIRHSPREIKATVQRALGGEE
jgi:hypothetical protein